MDVPPEALVPFLETDLDTHLVTLKFLTLFPHGCRCRFDRDPSGWASRVEFDASLFAWDRQVYPWARTIVFLDGTSASLLAAWADQPPEGPLVLKTADPRAQAVIEGRGLAAVRSFLWYGTDRAVGGDTTGVREVLGADPVFDALVIGNGYTCDELAGFRAQGARGYLAEEAGQPRAFCLAYPNFGPVWEVGSVKTLPGFERQGWASRVVRAAVDGILARGHRVRYHVEAANGPSRGLAGSLGLSPRVETRHYEVRRPPAVTPPPRP